MLHSSGGCSVAACAWLLPNGRTVVSIMEVAICLESYSVLKVEAMHRESKWRSNVLFLTPYPPLPWVHKWSMPAASAIGLSWNIF